MAENEVGFVQAGLARAASSVTSVVGGVANLGFQAYQKYQGEDIIKKQIEAYVDIDLGIRGFGAVEVSFRNVKLAAYVKYKIFELTGLTVDLNKSEIHFVTVMIDAGAFVRKTKMNAAELDALKRANREAASKANAKAEADAKAAVEAAAAAGGEAEEDIADMEWAAPDLVNSKDFVRLELEEMLVQAPGATILMRDLTLRATATPGMHQEWNLGGAHRSKVIAEMKSQIKEDLRKVGKEYKEPTNTNISEEVVEEHLGKEDEQAGADAEDEEHQPRPQKGSKTWTQSGRDLIASILSSTLLKDFHLHLSGLLVKVDTTALPLDEVPKFDMEFQAGELEIQHAGLFGEVAQRYDRLMDEGRGNDALVYHVKHLPLRVRLMANRTDHDAWTTQTMDGNNAASIRLFPHRSAEAKLSGADVRPMIEALFQMPELVKDPSLLEIELQHDDWKFFDIQGHLWSLEVKHGCKGYRLLWVPNAKGDDGQRLPLLKFHLSTRMDRISSNFKWLRRCYQPKEACMLFHMLPLTKDHGIVSMEDISSKLLKLQDFKKQCDMFLFRVDYYRSQSTCGKNSDAAKDVRMELDQHKQMLSRVMYLFQGSPTVETDEEGHMVTVCKNVPTLAQTQQLQIQQQLIDAAEKERDKTPTKQDDNDWLLDLMVKQTKVLSKYYRDKISFIQYETAALFEKVFWAQAHAELQEFRININLSSLYEVMNFVQDAQSEAFAAVKKKNTVQAHDVGIEDPFEFMQKKLEAAMAKADVDQDGQIDAAEWKLIVGDYAQTEEDDTQPEDMYKSVVAQVKQFDFLAAEAEDLNKLFKWYYTCKENFERENHQAIDAVEEDVENWIAPYKEDQGTYQALIKAAKDLKDRILDPSLTEDAQDFEAQLRETTKGLRVASGSQRAWLNLLDKMTRCQERKRKLIFGCHKISATVSRRIKADTEAGADHLPKLINSLVHRFGAESILDSEASPSALGIDIHLDIKGPRVVMCLVPDIDMREKCFCANGTPCAHRNEKVTMDLGRVLVTSPPDFDEWERPILYNRRQNNQIKIVHQGISVEAQVRKSLGSDELMPAPVRILYYPDQVSAIIQWELWNRPHDPCVICHPENISNLKIDVFAFNEQHGLKVPKSQQIYETGLTRANDPFGGMLGVKFPPEMALFGFRLAEYLADISHGKSGNKAQAQDQLQAMLSSQLSAAVPVQSLLPLKESDQMKMSLRTHFRSFLALSATDHDDVQDKVDGSGTVLYLISDSFAVTLDGKDTTIECESFEIDWNVAHFADLVGGLKPLLMDLDPVEDKRTDKELSYYEKFLKSKAAEGEIHGPKEVAREDVAQNFMSILDDDYSNRARAHVVCPSRKRDQPAFMVRLIKTHGTVDGVMIAMPQLVVVLSDFDFYVEAQATGLRVKIDGLTSMSMIHAHYKEKVMRNEKILQWKKATKEHPNADHTKIKGEVVKELTNIGKEMAQITKYPGEHDKLKPGMVQRLAIYASNVVARTKLETQDSLFGEKYDDRVIFAQLFTDITTPIHQLYFSLDLDIWMDPLFDVQDQNAVDQGGKPQSRSTYLRRGKESFTNMAAREPYKDIVEDAIDHHILGFDNSTLLTNLWCGDNPIGGWLSLYHQIMWILYYKPEAVNPDYVAGNFKGMTADVVNLWPLMGLANHTGTHLGIDTFQYNWPSWKKKCHLLVVAAWFGWTLDMLAGELGMLLLVITTWEHSWSFFFYYFPVYFFLLIIAPSWMHAITRLWSRPRLFAVLLIGWRCLTFHRDTDAQVPWFAWRSGYTWGDLVVDIIMTYCSVAGLVGTLRGLQTNQMFSQRLNPPWAHRRSALTFGGLIYLWMGCYDIVVASNSYKSNLENDCDPDVSLGTGILKILTALPFIFFTHIFKVAAAALTDSFMKLKTIETLKTRSAFKSLLSKKISDDMRNDLEDEQGIDDARSTGTRIFSAVVAIAILMVGAVDLIAFLVGFSTSVPTPFDFDAVFSGKFTYRLDDNGTRHELSELCEAQKAGFILSLGMIIWFIYAAIFSFTWRVKSWYNREQMHAYERRVDSVMEQYMAGQQFSSEEEKRIKPPPDWAASNKEWWDWIEESELSVMKLTELLHGSKVIKELEGEGGAKELAVLVTKRAIYGKLEPRSAAEGLIKKASEGKLDEEEAKQIWKRAVKLVTRSHNNTALKDLMLKDQDVREFMEKFERAGRFNEASKLRARLPEEHSDHYKDAALEVSMDNDKEDVWIQANQMTTTQLGVQSGSYDAM